MRHNMCDYIEDAANWWSKEIRKRYIRELTTSVHYALEGKTYNVPKINCSKINHFEKLLISKIKKKLQKNKEVVISGNADMVKRIAEECRIASRYIPENTMILTR